MTFFNKKSTFVPYIKGRDITVVANYSALPDPTTVEDKFYWCENSQGTAWLPGSLGGTYYPRGLYYSNGTTWEYMETPIQATQAEVDAGIIDDRFVSPNTLYNADQWNSVKVKLYTNGTLNNDPNTLNLVEGSNMTITDDGSGNITFDATGGGGDMLKSTYDTDNSGVVDNAEAIIVIGRNATGSVLRKGTIVYINGSTGNRPNFVKARANAESTSAGTFGVIVSDIANNADGNCCAIGYLDTLDTRSTATYPFTSDTLADGDTVYLSPTTAGYITNVKPSAPDHLVYLGKVTRTSPTNGTIIYRPQNGYELDEIHNVSASSPANKDGLFYNTSTSLWEARQTSTSDISGLKAPIVSVGNGTVITGAVTANVSTYSKGLLIPANSRGANDVPLIECQISKTGVAGNVQVRLYWNTTNNITTGSPILLGTSPNGAANWVSISRNLCIEVAAGGGNGTKVAPNTVSLATSWGTSTALPNILAIDWTQPGYLICAILAVSAADSSVCNMLKLN